MFMQAMSTGAAVVLVGLGTLVGSCAPKVAPADELRRVRDLASAREDDAKNAFDAGILAVAKKLRTYGDRELREIMEYVASETPGGVITTDVNFVVELRYQLFHLFAERQDLELLRQLAFIECPEYFGVSGAEYWFAVSSIEPTDGVLVLYNIATTRAIESDQKVCIESAIRRACFPHVRGTQPLEDCRDWLLKHRGKLLVNENYVAENERTAAPPDETETPLFQIRE